MRRARWIGLITLVCAIQLASTAWAFDGFRKGFVLGGGAGLGVTSYTQELTGGPLTVKSDREGNGALATTFKIGLGINEQTLLLWQANTNWFNFQSIGGDVILASGVGTITINHYFSEVGSAYLIAGLGFSNWAQPFESDSSSLTGGAVLAGVGINFSPNWSVEFTAGFGNPSDTVGSVKLETKATNIGIQVVGLAY